MSLLIIEIFRKVVATQFLVHEFDDANETWVAVVVTGITDNNRPFCSRQKHVEDLIETQGSAKSKSVDDE